MKRAGGTSSRHGTISFQWEPRKNKVNLIRFSELLFAFHIILLKPGKTASFPPPEGRAGGLLPLSQAFRRFSKSETCFFVVPYKGLVDTVPEGLKQAVN